MSIDALRIEEIVSEIRQKIQSGPNDWRSSSESSVTAVTAFQEYSRHAITSLASLDDSIAATGEKIGSCPPSPVTLRGRAGAVLVRMLLKVLWWQQLFVKDCIKLIVRRNRQQAQAFERISQTMADVVADSSRVSSGLDRMQGALLELQTHSRLFEGYEDRFTRFEAAIAGLRKDIQSRPEEQRLRDELARLSSAHVALADRIESLQVTIAEYNRGRLSEELAEEKTARQDLETRLHSELTGLRDSLHGLARGMSDLGLENYRSRAELSVQQQRLSLLLKEVRRSVPDSTPAPLHMESDGVLDELYLAFEDCFRGPRPEIKERLSVYIPILLQAGVGARSMPILDLGCGRGEWLELLGEHQVTARGVDKNKRMLAYCRALGLDVVDSDALSHLRTVPDRSLGGITSFHMIEHLPFEDLISLIDEALRVIKPNGLLILETPNPGSIAVGASTFYLDPTHVRPIPSESLRFFVEARGFCDLEVRALHPYPSTVRLPETNGGVTERFNQLFYGPQDYALIARRP